MGFIVGGFELKRFWGFCLALKWPIILRLCMAPVCFQILKFNMMREIRFHTILILIQTKITLHTLYDHQSLFHS